MSCPHTDTVPVEVRDHRTGKPEIVAQVCRDCLDRLPGGWGCSDCEWVESRTFADPNPKYYLARPCKEHQR